MKHKLAKLVCWMFGHSFYRVDGWRCLLCNHKGRAGNDRAVRLSRVLH